MPTQGRDSGRALLATGVLCVLSLTFIWLNQPPATAATPLANPRAMWLLSSAPFLFLAALAIAAYRQFEVMGQRLAADRSRLGRLQSDVMGAREFLRRAGGAASSGDEDERVSRGLTFSQQLAVPRDGHSLVGTGLDGVLRRRAVGETFTVAALRDDIGGVAERLTGRLHTLHLAAFAIGMGGTVVGLIIQLQIAKAIAGGGIISQDFLNGILLKASCTLVGLAVGWFAWWLQETLSDDVDRLGRDLETFVCVELGPELSQATAAGDPVRLVDLMVQQMRPVLLEMADEIRRAFVAAVDQTADRVRGLVTTELADTIAASLVTPFATEMSSIVMKLQAIESGVRVASEGLRAVSDTLTASAGGTGFALERLMQEITAASTSMRTVVTELQSVHGGFGLVTQDLRVLRGEMGETIEALRHVPTPALQKDVVADLIRLAEMVYGTLGRVNRTAATGVPA